MVDPEENESIPYASEIENAREIRELYQCDPLRPRYHFVNPEGHASPFDPNGALYWDGTYHLFYLFANNNEGETCWGHASSDDLLHWRFHQRSLVPDEHEKHMFSGDGFVTADGTPALIYHSVDVGNCIALAEDDDLLQWRKLDENPVMELPSWDPAGWRIDDTYYSLSGSSPQTEQRPDELLLYTATDLVDWDIQGPFITGDVPWDIGSDYSCPDFFELGDKHVLLFISHDKGAQCLVGEFRNERFYPEDHYWMNWPGGSFFAPESLVDDRGRRIFWSWVMECRTPEAQRDAGWSGVLSLPRTLSLDDTGDLRIEPVEELTKLRTNHRHWTDVDVSSNSEEALEDTGGYYLETNARIEVRDAREVGLRFVHSSELGEETLVSYRPGAETFTVDMHDSSSSGDERRPYPSPGVGFNWTPSDEEEIHWEQEAPLKLTTGESLELRAFLDGSVLEVFANGRQCLTQRLYPEADRSEGISLFAEGGSASIESVDVWDIQATNPW